MLGSRIKYVRNTDHDNIEAMLLVRIQMELKKYYLYGNKRHHNPLIEKLCYSLETACSTVLQYKCRTCIMRIASTTCINKCSEKNT